MTITTTNDTTYRQILNYCKFLHRYTTRTDFNNKSYRHFSTQSPETGYVQTSHQYLAELIDSQLEFSTFHQDFTAIITKFSQLVIDAEPFFYSFTGISLIYEVLVHALSDLGFSINKSKEPAILFSDNQILAIKRVKDQMTSIFEQNNVDLTSNNSTVIPNSSRSRTQNIHPVNTSNNNNDSNNDLNISIECLKNKLGSIETNIAQLTATINKKPDESQLLNQISKLIDSRFGPQSSTPLSTSITSISNNNSMSDESAQKAKSVKVCNTTDRLQILKLFEKKVKSENHVSLIETLNKNNRVLPELRHMNFPIPFLPDDQEFINDYNNLITKFQTDITSLILKHMATRIEHSNNQIQLITSKNKDLQSVVCSVEKEVYDNYKHKQISSHNKISRIINDQTPFLYQLKQRPSKQSTSRDYQQSEPYSPSSSPPNYFQRSNHQAPSGPTTSTNSNQEYNQLPPQPHASYQYRNNINNNNNIHSNNHHYNYHHDHNKNNNNRIQNNNYNQKKNYQHDIIDLTRADSGYSGSYKSIYNDTTNETVSSHNHLINYNNYNNNNNPNKPYYNNQHGYTKRVFHNSNSYKRNFDNTDSDRHKYQQPNKKSCHH